ncbi:MAG TPA: SGNH/GDSL hydrolase family protein, partial [Hyphomicrobiaceae bacterium]|nr:SGNH/GDSL hydrolase family protein [Hyphomicrobiaceae bacterium]
MDRTAGGRGREWLARVALVLLALGFALLLAELTLRISGLRYDRMPFVSDPVLHHALPRDYHYISEDPDGVLPAFAITYDDLGRPADPDVGRRARAGAPCRIALIGDSFTVANEVPYRSSFAGLLDAASPCEVRNFAVGSYSPMLHGLLWRERIAAFKPDLVIIQIFSNDIWDDQVYAKSARRDGAGRVTAVPGASGEGFAEWRRRLYVARLLRRATSAVQWWWQNRGRAQTSIDGYVEENPELTELSLAEMRRLVADIRAANVPLLLTVVPSKVRLLTGTMPGPAKTEFAERWQAWAEREGVRFVDLVAPFHAAKA